MPLSPRTGVSFRSPGELNTRIEAAANDLVLLAVRAWRKAYREAGYTVKPGNEA